MEGLKRARVELATIQVEEHRGNNRSKILRVLEGIPYWVIEDPLEIGELICNNVRKEWEADISEQEDHEEGRWLKSLEKRKWRLVTMELGNIMLRDQIMNYTNEATGYNFRRRLQERVDHLNRDLDKFGAIIRPLIIRADDSQLMDGYCRYHVLLKRGIKEAYTYVGSL